MTPRTPPRRPRAASVPQQDRAEATRRQLLDAAVDELLTVGYARLTTSAVAARADVSRGAQQYHFPHKATLVAEAVRHLGKRQVAELRALGTGLSERRARSERVLDAMFELYTGPLFAAMLELSIAAPADGALREVIGDVERTISRQVREVAPELLGGAGAPDFPLRVGMALSATRGTALLHLLGHPPDSVARQWRFTRAEIIRLLEAQESSHD
jgi:AcrR family transcriptional regulator